MKRSSVSFAVAAALTAASSAAADPPKSSDPAAAQALFYEARALMKDGKFEVACPKLEESLRLDYGVGTEFNLADCSEKLGKIASAWSGFINVAAASKAQNQPQREKVARDRAKAIEPRLPKLTIEVAAPAPGLEVKRDGVLIGSASWGSPTPVDPGSHRVSASAPGRQTWDGAIDAAEGKVAKITVPQLALAAEASTPPSSSSVDRSAHAAIATPPPVTVRTPEDPSSAFPEPVVERGATQRTLGWIIGGAGVAALGVSAGFGIDSLQKRDRAKDHCDGDICDPTGISLRDGAIRSGDIATVVGISGGAAVLGGIVLVLTAPRTARRQDLDQSRRSRRHGVVGAEPQDQEVPTASIRAIRAAPHIAANGFGVSIQGVLP